jgi:hypothetical protein
MTIRLHIERLVLDGLPLEAAHATAVQAAVEAELTRLLAESGLAPGVQQGGALAYARGADLRLSPTPAPDVLGQQIGTAIHQSLRP